MMLVSSEGWQPDWELDPAPPGEDEDQARAAYERWVRPPWPYRLGLTNWLISRPWRWQLRSVYRMSREGFPPVGRPLNDFEQHAARDPRNFRPCASRLRSLWRALSFPHVHYSPAEDAPRWEELEEWKREAWRREIREAPEYRSGA